MTRYLVRVGCPSRNREAVERSLKLTVGEDVQEIPEDAGFDGFTMVCHGGVPYNIEVADKDEHGNDLGTPLSRAFTIGVDGEFFHVGPLPIHVGRQLGDTEEVETFFEERVPGGFHHKGGTFASGDAKDRGNDPIPVGSYPVSGKSGPSMGRGSALTSGVKDESKSPLVEGAKEKKQ